MKKSIRLYLSGSVQGVFFRQFIKENADKRRVKGYVRNLSDDGRVEIFLEGNSEDVDSLIAICKRGPQHAQIRNVEEKEEKFQDFKEFKILRV
ncbi:acylphosphatase [Candidatus Pacearchaeota archaeon]|nr:acylphosphatase [Candidatus Pacearchaeota archaeon]